MARYIKGLAPAMRFESWRHFSWPATTQRSRRLLSSTPAAMSSPQQPSPPPGSSIPPLITPLRRTRSAFAGNVDHYDLRMQLFQISTSTEFEGNTAGHCRTVSGSGQRYSPVQALHLPSSAGDDDRHRVGGVWSEHRAFFTTMAGPAEKVVRKSSSPEKASTVKKPPMAPPRLGKRARDDRLERWLLDLAENNARFGAAPTPDGGNSGDSEPPDAPPKASPDTPRDAPSVP